MRFAPGDLVAVKGKMGFVARPTPGYFTTTHEAMVYGRFIEEDTVCLVVSTYVASEEDVFDSDIERDRVHVMLLSSTTVLGWGDEEWLDRIA